MEQEVQELQDEPSDPSFAEKVEELVTRRKRLFGAGPVQCDNCPRAFATKWELN